MDKLRVLLKQTENLVQDLQEELEMKDSMRVKELHSENYDSQGTCDNSFCDKELNAFSPEKHMGNFPITDCKKSYNQKEEESSESMSKIEAELEAELERLGLNMNESSPETPLSELVESCKMSIPNYFANLFRFILKLLGVAVERYLTRVHGVLISQNLLQLDPDFLADLAQGELQTDVIGGEKKFHSELYEDDGDTVVPVNYAVSPHELTLRLHNVIQSRLEGRVQELEIALENSQRKLWFMESEDNSHSQKCFSIQASSSSEGNMLAYNNCEPMTEPLDMNSSGESPGAYNDTYFEEIIKIDDFEENSPSSIHITDCKVDSHSHDLHVLGVQHCVANDLHTFPTVNELRLSRELSSGEVTMLEGLSSSNYESNDVTGDENCECDYEVERQLIRQIVERTKKGSPVFQNARRILYSMDGVEH
ncbi:unnamed protein product [Sphenostylis stenocarpa]|uniref:Uncharacterized protein n=1 Tax=Sphenostylis stenocarpa TaxID=92480 RepID=A0AA86SE37_9FABA|nr:unnamed protein product [Sphenostylis stenocarpa]